MMKSLLLIVLLFIFSCGKKVDSKVVNDEPEQVVVEGGDRFSDLIFASYSYQIDSMLNTSSVFEYELDEYSINDIYGVVKGDSIEHGVIFEVGHTFDLKVPDYFIDSLKFKEANRITFRVSEFEKVYGFYVNEGLYGTDEFGVRFLIKGEIINVK